MFADLDDPAPPRPDVRVRTRVDARTESLVRRERRRRRSTRVALVAAIVVFVLVVGTAVVVAGSRSSGDRAPAAPPGDVIVTWSFSGHPDRAGELETVARLNHRFADVHDHAHAELEADQVVVSAPSGERPTVASLNALAQPGVLQFRSVLYSAPVNLNGSVVPPPSPVGTANTVPQLDPHHPSAVQTVYWVGPVAVDGSAFESVSTDLSQDAQWEIRPVFKAGAAGIDKFNALAAVCYAGRSVSACPAQPGSDHGQIAVVIDGRALTAPTIDNPSFQRDQITISGEFTQQQAENLAALVDSGALPAPLAV